MYRWAGKVALVTGASVGIGAQITTELAKNGMKVVAVARRLEKLKELAANINEGSTETYRKILDVNVLAMAIGSRELVQSVKKRKASGHIININSIAGHFAESIRMPVSVYCASKYAVTGMTLSLRNEIVAAKLDIKITSISPGMVKTAMVTDVFNQMGMDTTFEGIPVLEDTDIAEAVIYTLSVPKRVQICEMVVMPHEALATKDPRPYGTNPQ
ncbi:farnesol dehydrogenase-like isoform X2 [Anoplolepis gracilipes]|uniref:farnesol dehydrogenase-like isoform X2 n=1 Tax=Anoplolepis gracilipes TaxID=354296 RepID=UPI003B9FA138